MKPETIYLIIILAIFGILAFSWFMSGVQESLRKKRINKPGPMSGKPVLFRNFFGEEILGRVLSVDDDLVYIQHGCEHYTRNMNEIKLVEWK